MGLLESIKKLISTDNNSSLLDANNSKVSISKNNLYIHPDLIDLLWIGDGKYKNFNKKPKEKETYTFDGFNINVSYFGPDEPSLLFLSLPLKKPINPNLVDRPPYYPFYSDLSPEQRWMYWKFLSDPYNPNNDIGYVFIFYYGLERHLLYGNFEKAFNLILKLRDVYSNKSFQQYSSSALILSSMLHKRPDYAKIFIDSLDQEHEFYIPAELYILCKFGLNIPITAFDLIHFHKFFGFTNNRYIKSNKDLFMKNLVKNIKEATGGNDIIYASNYFTKADVSKLKNIPVKIFANVSIREKEVLIPNIAQASTFTGSIFMILNKTHEDTKRELASIRKSSKSQTNLTI